MSFHFSMGFSYECEHQLENEEGEVGLVIEESYIERSEYMDLQHYQDHVDMEFWPIEHPLEPQEEDHPVKCPTPPSSLINHVKGRDKKFVDEEVAKRKDEESNRNKKGMMLSSQAVQGVRKRQHALTGDENTRKLETRCPTQNVTIYQMLHRFE